MDLSQLLEATKTLGLPVVISMALVWHFIWINRRLTRANEALLGQVSVMQRDIADAQQRLQVISHTLTMNIKQLESMSDLRGLLDTNRKLVDQNEFLVGLTDRREKASLVLLRQVVDARLRDVVDEEVAS